MLVGSTEDAMLRMLKQASKQNILEMNSETFATTCRPVRYCYVLVVLSLFMSTRDPTMAGKQAGGLAAPFSITYLHFTSLAVGSLWRFRLV